MEDTTPVLADSTAGVELAGEAEKAITAKPEALVPGAHNEGGRGSEVEMPPYEGARGTATRGQAQPGALQLKGNHMLEVPH